MLFFAFAFVFGKGDGRRGLREGLKERRRTGDVNGVSVLVKESRSRNVGVLHLKSSSSLPILNTNLYVMESLQLVGFFNELIEAVYNVCYG